jgi:hypothetical protein
MQAAATETAETSSTRRNYVDFYSMETGELLLAHDLDRPHFLLANAIGGWETRNVRETVAELAGVVADRDSVGWLMLGWGESVAETSRVSERVFDKTGTIHMTGGKLFGEHGCSYVDPTGERSRTVKFVMRTDWGTPR